MKLSQHKIEQLCVSLELEKQNKVGLLLYLTL